MLTAFIIYMLIIVMLVALIRDILNWTLNKSTWVSNGQLHWSSQFATIQKMPLPLSLPNSVNSTIVDYLFL